MRQASMAERPIALPPEIGSIAVPSSDIGQSNPKEIERPPCSKCGTPMMLARIEPDEPDHDKRTYECPKCEHAETVVVKYK
jgi:ssDNA-binding Zn-finger/Zn-ribbon topoisomerase 1